MNFRLRFPRSLAISALPLLLLVTMSANAQRQPPIDSNLTSKAVEIPDPSYPPAARALKLAGTVSVEVTVDEKGNVILATAKSGNPLLTASAENAARKAKFKPFLMLGSPVKVRGTLVYGFAETGTATVTNAVKMGGTDGAPAQKVMESGAVAEAQPALMETADVKGGFPASHKLVGRYKSQNGFNYFTFAADGTVKKSFADAGNLRGGDYTVGGQTAGTYDLKGFTLTIKYENGKTENFEIEIYRCCEVPDYNETSPTILKINHAQFINVD